MPECKNLYVAYYHINIIYKKGIDLVTNFVFSNKDYTLIYHCLNVKRHTMQRRYLYCFAPVLVGTSTAYRVESKEKMNFKLYEE
jgi:hypothetical protein